MRNYRTLHKQATSGAFVLKKINFKKFGSSILVPPIEATPSDKVKSGDFLKLALVLIALFILYLLNRPRLQAYNDCYIQNYKQWGSCQELGGGETIK